MRLPILSFVAITALSCVPQRPADQPPDSWSKPVNGLQARLDFAHKETVNGTPIIITYLELQSVSSSGSVMEIPWNQRNLQFTVTDAAGKEVAPADGPFDEITAEIGMLRLPHDSTLRLNIASRGAGIAKDQAAHLDLGPLTHWYFKRGDEKTYYLQAKLTIEQTKASQLHGSIDIPKAKILIPSTPD
jgi:hypothetical protein